MTSQDELKTRLSQLDALIASGVLKGKEARQARSQLEAQLRAAGQAPAAAAGPVRPSPRLLAGLGLFALALTAAGYAWLGNPAGWSYGPGSSPAQAQAPADSAAHAMDAKQFEAMAERLAERLKNQPDDAEGWTMLSRSYAVLGQFDKAVVAYQRVVKLRPDDAQVHADYADALAMANGRKLDGEPERLLKRALALDPDNAKALSLAGTLAFDRGDAATAARHWERALQRIEPGSELAQQLQGALADARQRAGLPAKLAEAPAQASAEAAAPAQPAAVGASLRVRVSLAPELAAKAAPDDTLFVFARASQGPKAPLAIQRRQVKDLPLELTLDDSMAMSPALKLSSVEQVVVGARISKSGNAMPQPGDMQALSEPLKVSSGSVQLQIKQVLP